MNVVILGTEQTSQNVAYIVENAYNSWRNGKLARPLNIAAYITNEGIKFPVIGDKAVLNFKQFIMLYHKKVIEKNYFSARSLRSSKANFILFSQP